MGNQYLNEKRALETNKKMTGKKAAGIIYVATQIVKSFSNSLHVPFIPFAAEELWKTLNLSALQKKQKME